MARSVFSSRFVPSFHANLYRIYKREINEINQTISVEIANYVDDIGRLDRLRWEGGNDNILLSKRRNNG